MALQTLPLDAIPDKALSAWAGGDIDTLLPTLCRSRERAAGFPNKYTKLIS